VFHAAASFGGTFFMKGTVMLLDRSTGRAWVSTLPEIERQNLCGCWIDRKNRGKPDIALIKEQPENSLLTVIKK
jgi:hypothetical protein